MARRVRFRRTASGVIDGVYASKPGIDVMAAGITDEDLAFSSDWTNVLKIHRQGVLTDVPTNGSLAFKSWPSLGYIPFVQINFISSLDGNYQPYCTPTPYLAADKFVHALAFHNGLQYTSKGLGTVTIYYTIYRAQAFAS